METRDNANLEYSKWMELSRLKQGSKVKLTDGSIAQFIKLKQRNFDGIIDGKNYNIPVTMFVEVLEVAKDNLEYKNLKKGDLFYINEKASAGLYIFDCIEKGRIIGINPISKCKTRIDTSLYVGSIDNLIKNNK